MIHSVDGNRKLPDGWKLKKLGEVCSVHPGQHILESDYNEAGIGVGYLTGPADFGSSYPYISKWTEQPKAWCEPGDVLVTVKGAGVGKANLAPHEPVAIGRQLMAVRPKTGLADQRFIFFLVQSRLLTFQSRALGSTVPGLGREDIESLSVTLPPLPEQRRIVSILNEQLAAMEKAKAAAETGLEVAKALHTAFMRDFFNSSESRNWPKLLLGEVGEVVAGVTLGRNLGHKKTRLVPYLRVANVKDAYLDLNDLKQTEATEDEIERLRLRRGDLLLTEGGDPDKLGRGTFWAQQIPECIHQNHIFRVRLSERQFLPEFVATQISSSYGKAYFLKHAKQTTGIATINQRVLKAFPLMAPELTEQEDVMKNLSEKLSIAAHMRDLIEEELLEIKALPASILRKAFNGEL